MVYEHDHQASQEAAEYAPSDEQIATLGQNVQRQRQRIRLGAEGVRGHRVTYDPAAWDGLIPDILASRNTVSRGEVFDLAQQAISLLFSRRAFCGGMGIADMVRTAMGRSSHQPQGRSTRY